jgi:lysophospholipase L1-like esterase
MVKPVRIAALGLVVLSLASSPGHAFTKGFPDKMAAIGDSITQAANLDGSNIGASNPEHSWSTGYDSGDIVLSHYERLLKKNRNIRNRNYNDAVSGARMDDAPGQAQNAVAQGVEYVTIEMGGNDVCTSSEASMTPVDVYESYFRQTMSILTSGLPTAKIYVLSVPDVYQLWSLFHNNFSAQFVWQSFGVCQAMLDEGNSEADRQFVRARNIAFNDVLARVCAEYTQCRWDNNAMFNYQFTSGDVSHVDYFHPSLQGQATIASRSWSAGYWLTA